MSKYIGKVVFVEGGKNNYYNGEYIVVQESKNTIHGVSTNGGYESSTLHCFNLTGDKACQVIDIYEDDDFILGFCENLEYFAKTPERGEKKQWIDCVYTKAADNARLIRRALEKKNRETSKQLPEITGTLTLSANIENSAHTIIINGVEISIKKVS